FDIAERLERYRRELLALEQCAAELHPLNRRERNILRSLASAAPLQSAFKLEPELARDGRRDHVAAAGIEQQLVRPAPVQLHLNVHVVVDQLERNRGRLLSAGEREITSWRWRRREG